MTRTIKAKIMFDDKEPTFLLPMAQSEADWQKSIHPWDENKHVTAKDVLNQWGIKKPSDEIEYLLSNLKKVKEFVSDMSMTHEGPGKTCYEEHVINEFGETDIVVFNKTKSALKQQRLNWLKKGTKRIIQSWTNHYIATAKPNLAAKRPKEYYAWATLVKARNKKCVKCGSVDTLHAHHIEHWKDNEDLRYDLDNGVTLCEDCHKMAHAMNWTRADFFDDEA